MVGRSRKRPVEVIDLTGDDTVRASSSRAAKAAKVTAAIPTSNEWPDYFAEDDAVEVVDNSQGYSDQSLADFDLYGKNYSGAAEIHSCDVDV